jgi:hypothetical protein
LKKIISTWINIRTLIVFYILLAIIAAVQSYYLPVKVSEDGEKHYTHYNNYLIFKQSHYHLLEGKDLYKEYPDEHWDFYKYSPAFALFFGIFAWLPDLLGLCLWNLTNVLFLLFAIHYLPAPDAKKKIFMLITIIIELMTSLQNGQSNGLVAGLIILSFGLLEKNKPLPAALCLMFSVFIKIFGLVAFALFLFYPKKWKFGLFVILWFIVFLALPLIVVPLGQLQALYSNWMNMLASDHSASYGLSVMGWIATWFGISVDKIILVLVGAVLFMLPFIRTRQYDNLNFRLLALASVLIWVVIFNHKAESPTFIIAMSGISIWFYSRAPRTENILLLAIALIFTSLSPTDLFPGVIRENLIIPYVLKAVPCIAIWIKIFYEMMAIKPKSMSEVRNPE